MLRGVVYFMCVGVRNVKKLLQNINEMVNFRTLQHRENGNKRKNKKCKKNQKMVKPVRWAWARREMGRRAGKNGIWQKKAEHSENEHGKYWEIAESWRKKRIIYLF